MSSSILGNNTSRSHNTITTKITSDPFMQKTIDTIRDVASNNEASSRMRDVVQAVIQSGAVDGKT